ncbi:MAG: molybdopterin-guanine dinucleotide biosynthesis protein B [Candidatus Caldatribacteriota bacterium]|nr:molybdopterin-guanine dinucleotide biosynthesis protein B [Candidatus Caldatribacteriota bacterium]
MKFVGIIGYKKSGKTTLLLKLTKELISQGYRVAAIKHISRDIDMVNTDTEKIKQRISQVAAITPNESILFLKNKSNLEEIIKHLEADIVLVEGLKKEKTYPKIVCLREEKEKSELFDGLQLCTTSLVDNDTNSSFSDFNILNDEDVKEMSKIIISKAFKLPNLDCGACGFQNCYELAQEIVKGNKTVGDCFSLKSEVVVKANGKIIPMNPFISKMVKNTIMGLLSPLKEFGKGNIEIKIKEK